MRAVMDEALIDPNVVRCHAARSKALLETAADLAAIQCSHSNRSDAGLIDIVDDHAGYAFVDDLRHRASAIGEDTCRGWMQNRSHGNVVGVIVGKLNLGLAEMFEGNIPQNVNFAIKGSVIIGFLEANNVGITPPPAAATTLQPTEIAERAKQFSVQVTCKS
jgi:hypothetical protein